MKRGNVIGVDVGGTYFRVGLVNSDKVIKFIRKPTPKDKKNFLKMLVDLVNEIGVDEIKGIGIGAPGPLKNGFIINPPNIPLKDFDLKRFVNKEFGLKCEVENDAKCTALAELHYGYGKGKKNFSSVEAIKRRGNNRDFTLVARNFLESK